MEHELPHVLDGVDEPVTVEELEQVVRRAGQRRRASLVAGAAALLALGSVAGAVARGPVGSRPAGFAAEGQGTPPPRSPQDQSMPSFGHVGGQDVRPTFTSLFRREANGVAIRAYRVTIRGDAHPPAQDPACAPPTSFVQAGLSNTAAVGLGTAPELAGDDLAVLSTGQFGHDEGQPATWAIVRGGAGITKVRVTAGAATDAMAPEGGIAVLAVGGAAKDGVVEGLGPNGAVVATRPLAFQPPPLDPACFPPPCLPPPPPGSGAAEPAGPPPADQPAGAPPPDQVVTDGKPACGTVVEPTPPAAASGAPATTAVARPARSVSPVTFPEPWGPTTMPPVTAVASPSTSASRPAS